MPSRHSSPGAQGRKAGSGGSNKQRREGSQSKRPGDNSNPDKKKTKNPDVAKKTIAENSPTKSKKPQDNDGSESEGNVNNDEKLILVKPSRIQKLYEPGEDMRPGTKQLFKYLMPDVESRSASYQKLIPWIAKCMAVKKGVPNDKLDESLMEGADLPSETADPSPDGIDESQAAEAPSDGASLAGTSEALETSRILVGSPAESDVLGAVVRILAILCNRPTGKLPEGMFKWLFVTAEGVADRLDEVNNGNACARYLLDDVDQAEAESNEQPFLPKSSRYYLMVNKNFGVMNAIAPDYSPFLYVDEHPLYANKVGLFAAVDIPRGHPISTPTGGFLFKSKEPWQYEGSLTKANGKLVDFGRDDEVPRVVESTDAIYQCRHRSGHMGVYYHSVFTQPNKPCHLGFGMGCMTFSEEKDKSVNAAFKFVQQPKATVQAQAQYTIKEELVQDFSLAVSQVTIKKNTLIVMHRQPFMTRQVPRTIRTKSEKPSKGQGGVASGNKSTDEKQVSPRAKSPSSQPKHGGSLPSVPRKQRHNGEDLTDAGKCIVRSILYHLISTFES